MGGEAAPGTWTESWSLCSESMEGDFYTLFPEDQNHWGLAHPEEMVDLGNHEQVKEKNVYFNLSSATRTKEAGRRMTSRGPQERAQGDWGGEGNSSENML